MATHPTDRHLAALIDHRLDRGEARDVAHHVRACRRCQLRIGQAPDQPAPAVFAVALDIPFAVHEEVRTTAPARGDLWRLVWDDAVAVALVWSTEPEVSVLPLIDPIDVDGWTVELTEDESSFGVPVAVPVDLLTTVPPNVLDARIGAINNLGPIAERLTALQNGVPTAIHRTLVDDDVAEAHENLGELMATFREATWAPLALSGVAPSFHFDELIDAGLEPNRALAIFRGAVASLDEADAIESTTGRRPWLPAIADSLRSVIDMPRWKPALRDRARRAGRSEGEERRRVAYHMQPALLAARGTQGRPIPPEVLLAEILNA
jgi:hypothetical protein